MTPLTLRHLATRLPDIPRWVEARDLLLTGRGEIHGLKDDPEPSLLLRDPDADSLFVIGAPSLSLLRDIAAQGVTGGIIATPEQAGEIAAALPGWTRSPIMLHLLSAPDMFPPSDGGDVAFIDVGALDGISLPSDLRHELESGAESSPIAAAFVDGAPVSFCYAGAQTESLWDVAIDTLEPFRRQGCAALCAALMIRHMGAAGMQPVWASYENYPPSWQLARKLGFVAVDGLVQFDPSNHPA